MKHGEHRGCADSRADEEDGRVGSVEEEGAPRCSDLESIPDAKATVEISTGRAGGLALHGDPVVPGVGRTGERVVPEHRLRVAVGMDAQGEVLTRLGGRESCSFAVLEADRDHRIALVLDRSDGERTEPRPRWGRACDSQAGVSLPRRLVEQGAERGLPPRAERRHSECLQQLLARVSGKVEQRVGLGDGQLLRARRELDDLVSRLHLTFLEDSEVEAGATVRDEERGNARVVHADPDAVARDPRLGDFEGCRPDLVVVTDADLVVAEAVDREVLAELAVDQVVAPELSLPVSIGIDLVDEDGPLLAPVAGSVALSVALDIEGAHVAGAVDGVFEHPGEDGPAPPAHVLRHADVHGEQLAHDCSGCGCWHA